MALDPTPRFRPSTTHEVDPVRGCLEAQVPPDHLARSVWAVIEKLDTSALETGYSALGRHGYHPKRLLAVWVYASLIGLHYSTQVARACRTDAAFQWLCGGACPSGATLRRMRRQQGHLFALALEQTVLLGHAAGLVELDALAVDSVRVRAHASLAAVRTKKRSAKRLQELAQVDVAALDRDARARHEAQVAKHQQAVAVCAARGVASYVTTNELAALMKFPSGASAPGHRTTVVASGRSARFVIGVLVDAAPTDQGKLGQAVLQAREILDRLGIRQGRGITVAADAGYSSDDDLQFVDQARDWADILIPDANATGKFPDLFPRERFVIQDDGTAICPAGTTMLGPYPNDKVGECFKWVGVGCATCALKPQCTKGRVRSIQVAPKKERRRQAMRDRMARPGARERYNQRIATVEPVFSFLEDTMRFRRASSRHPDTIVSEICLKLLAYNIDRLIRAERRATPLICIWFVIELECY